MASKPVDFRKGMDSLAALVMQALAVRSVHRRCLYLSLEEIGPVESAGLGWVRAVPDDQASGERRVHLAARARRGGDAERGAVAAAVHRHGLDPARRPRFQCRLNKAARQRREPGETPTRSVSSLHGVRRRPLPREPDTLIEMIVELRDENGKLRAMLETLRRALYGARSERFDTDPGQLALGLEDVSTTPVEPEPEAAKPRSQDGRTRAKPMRNIGGLPKHLPREDVVIEPASDRCPCCQGTLHRIGEDVSEMLDIVPAILRVKRIHRPRYGCRACESAVVQAPAPPRPVEGGLPTTALLAHVAAAKFAWHLPLHRQTQMLGGYGIDLDRSTLVHWIGRTAWWLQPLYALLTRP